MTTAIPPNPPRWSPSPDPPSIIIPGLDTNAPINDQIDQIEQLITMKLQNIDANFSKIQNLMATRLLPAVKRYAVSTEPVREAAKFWTSFYEQAAQVHIPTFDSYTSTNDEPSQTSITHPDSKFVPQPDTDPDATPLHTLSQANTGTYDVTASESSFMPTNAVSSTPARATYTRDQSHDDQPSWNASLESPMVRLDRELQSFARETEEGASASDSFAYDEENTVQQLIIQGKGSSELHRDHLQSNIQSSRIPRSTLPTPRANVSPLKVKPKTPNAIPKHLQPYLPPTSQAEPPLLSPRRTRYERSPRKLLVTSSTSSTLDIPSLTQHLSDPNPQEQFADFNDSFDDSVDLMQGMSPPRTMAFARAPRSSVGLGLLPPLGRTPGRDLLPALGRTPAKEAADRIRRDLLGDMQSHFESASREAANRRTPAFGYGRPTTKDDTMSTILTPPSLSRYTRHAYPSRTDSNDTDASLESMMRRVGLGLPDSSSKTNAIASSSRPGELSQQDPAVGMDAPPVREEELHTPDQQASDAFHFHQDDESAIQPNSHSHPNSDSDSDSDSLNDEPAHPGQPSTAFLMASSRDPGPDDSFGSSNSNHSIDSLGEEGFGGGSGAAVHPFARALEAGDGDGFDDSFDSVEGDGFDAHRGEDHDVEETVFGIPPAQRQRTGVKGNGELWLLGENLLQDTIGIGSQLAKAGRVDESPTPFGRG
ncbi:hypothetical protein PAXRUDRAFT_821247 [Paxillus rubicundulus Ve08.2h10]|uniref:DASH complex subunit ASK1 n=1 Tax=Paxillus rubicundulus Ve08.2h10 TaxID=930991 RepID=A0A0D0EDA8_9AGAM|nr:hypothetical protein PAXRUDRAFT_821247 [Paxillus rubicundulus Ve08.2h10]